MKETTYMRIALALVALLFAVDAAAQWKQLPIPSVHGRIACGSDGSLMVLTNGTLCYSDASRTSWTFQPFPYDLNNRTQHGQTRDHPPRQLLLASDDTLLFISDPRDVYSLVRGEETLRSASEGLSQKKRYHYNHGPHLLTSRGKHGELLLCHDDFYASTNNGASWELRYSDPEPGSFSPGAVDERNPDVSFLFKSYENKTIHKSTDAGATWRQIQAGLGAYEARDMLVCPDGQVHAGRYYSSDYGETWRAYDMGNPDRNNWGDRNLKYMYNKQEHGVYTINLEWGLFFRDLNNPSFQVTTLSTYGERVMPDRSGVDVTYDALTGKVFAIINDSLYEYQQGKVTVLNNTVSAAPVTALLAYNAEGDTLLVTTPLATLKTTDAGRTWVSTSMGGGGADRFEMMHSRRSKDLIYQIDRTRYIVWVVENERSTRKTISPGTYCKLVYDPFSTDTFHGGANGLWRMSDSTVLNAPDGGLEINSYTSTPAFVRCIAFDKRSEGALLLAGVDWDDVKTPQLHRTSNYGYSWSRISSITLNEPPIDMIFDDAVENRILVIEPTGVHISTDDGESWEFRDPGLGSRKITSVAIDPDNASTMFLGVTSPSRLDPIPQSREDGGGVWKSTDSGYSWSKLPIDGLHNYNISHVLAFRNPRRVLVGTPCGAYEYLLDSTTSVTPPGRAPTGGVEFEIYPNPGRGVVTARYSINTPSPVRLALYDVLGRLVATQTVDAPSGGSHTMTMDTTDLREGVYIVTLATQIGTAVRRLLVVR
jgi:hypothetical protein